MTRAGPSGLSHRQHADDRGELHKTVYTPPPGEEKNASLLMADEAIQVEQKPLLTLSPIL